MKRPEGFDPRKPEPTPPAARKKRAPSSPSQGTPRTPGIPRAKVRSKPAAVAPERVPQKPERAPRKLRAKPADSVQTPVRRGRTRKSDATAESTPATGAGQARKAARERRRFERDEVRRFTRRIRHRRLAWISAGAVLAILLGTVAIAVYSPILALTTIEVTGTSSVNPEEIHQAVEGQLGTPLALVDKDQLTRDLAKFTLIQSYVTEIVPPNTMIIHVTERKPIGAMVVGAQFIVVDPAGVVIEKTEVRPPGVPTIEIEGADTDSEVFDAVVEVLLMLPAPVAESVDRVTAATKDDVTLILAGAGQRVVWGSAENSELKARVLAKLMATQDPNARIEYDVTAPLNAVIRPV